MSLGEVLCKSVTTMSVTIEIYLVSQVQYKSSETFVQPLSLKVAATLMLGHLGCKEVEGTSASTVQNRQCNKAPSPKCWTNFEIQANGG